MRDGATLRARSSGPGLIFYLTLGDPDAERSRHAALELAEAGALALELGLPTLRADEGPTLARSHARGSAAIDEGRALELMAEIAEQTRLPIVALSYWTALGSREAMRRQLEASARAGARAALVVGLPYGELRELTEVCARLELETVLTLPSGAPDRLRRSVYAAATGCLYLRPSPHLSLEIDRMRAETPLPIIVGGGVANANDVAGVLRAGANAAVLGAPVAERLEQGLPLAAWARGLLGS